jgi:hypothetical protein
MHKNPHSLKKATLKISRIHIEKKIERYSTFSYPLVHLSRSSPTPVPAPTGIALASTTRPHDAISFRIPATTPAGTYRVQVFRTAATRIGGGQGEVLLATRDVTVTTSSGAFTIGSLAGILAGDRSTLTATRIEAGVPKGTSAFSSAVTAG